MVTTGDKIAASSIKESVNSGSQETSAFFAVADLC